MTGLDQPVHELIPLDSVVVWIDDVVGVKSVGDLAAEPSDGVGDEIDR